MTLQMRSDVIPVSELASRDVQAWRELGLESVAPNPFAMPELVLPATRGWGTRDVGVLAVREGTEWRAALPVRNVHSYRSVPGACLVGWRHSYCYLGTPLVAPGATEAAVEALIAGGLRVGRSLVLDWIDDDGPLAEPLSAALGSVSRPVVLERFGRAALYRREQGDYLEHSLSSQHRSEYRRRRHKLEQQVGPLELRDESDDPSAYARFLALERSSWKGAAGTALAVRGHADFFTDVCSNFAQSGRLRLMSLRNDERTVAMLCDIVAGSTAYGFKITFDQDLRRFGPGLALMIAYIGHFHAAGLTLLDSCADVDNATLNRLLADRRPLRSAVATARGPAGAIDFAKWSAASAALPLRRRFRRTRGHGAHAGSESRSPVPQGRRVVSRPPADAGRAT